VQLCCCRNIQEVLVFSQWCFHIQELCRLYLTILEFWSYFCSIAVIVAQLLWEQPLCKWRKCKHCFCASHKCKMITYWHLCTRCFGKVLKNIVCFYVLCTNIIPSKVEAFLKEFHSLGGFFIIIWSVIARFTFLVEPCCFLFIQLYHNCIEAIIMKWLKKSVDVDDSV